MGEPTDDPLMLNATLKNLKTGKDLVEPAPGAAPAAKATATPDAQIIFENTLGVGAGDTIIDIPARPEFDALTAMLGGKEAIPQAAQDLREVVALAGIADIDEALAGLTPEEANAQIMHEIKEYRAALANPMKAQALLAEIYDHPMQEPGKSYFTGKGSPALNEAIAKLWQAASGTLVTGRSKSKGDGFTY